MNLPSESNLSWPNDFTIDRGFSLVIIAVP